MPGRRTQAIEGHRGFVGVVTIHPGGFSSCHLIGAGEGGHVGAWACTGLGTPLGSTGHARPLSMHLLCSC